MPAATQLSCRALTDAAVQLPGYHRRGCILLPGYTGAAAQLPGYHRRDWHLHACPSTREVYCLLRS